MNIKILVIFLLSILSLYAEKEIDLVKYDFDGDKLNDTIKYSIESNGVFINSIHWCIDSTSKKNICKFEYDIDNLLSTSVSIMDFNSDSLFDFLLINHVSTDNQKDSICYFILFGQSKLKQYDKITYKNGKINPNSFDYIEGNNALFSKEFKFKEGGLKAQLFKRTKKAKGTGKESSDPILNLMDLTTISISPNPVENLLKLKIDHAKKDNYMLNIYDVDNKLVLNFQIALQEGYNLIEKEVSILSSGIYFLQLSNQKQLINQKFIILR